jgi:hypothetical protein
MATYRLINTDTSEVLNLDRVVDLDIGTPARAISAQEIASDGAIVKGSGRYKGRRIKGSTIFFPGKELERRTFLAWISQEMYKNIYLERIADDGFIGRMKIWGSLDGGEKYASQVSDPVSFSLYSESPYFEQTTYTQHTFTLSGTDEEIKTVINSYQRVQPIIQFTPASNFTLFRVVLTEGYGILISGVFTASDLIEIDLSGRGILVTVNGVDAGVIWSAESAPFELLPGTNSLYIIGTDCATNELIIKYKARQI